jgi:hypothetical protein
MRETPMQVYGRRDGGELGEDHGHERDDQQVMCHHVLQSHVRE